MDKQCLERKAKSEDVRLCFSSSHVGRWGRRTRHAALSAQKPTYERKSAAQGRLSSDVGDVSCPSICIDVDVPSNLIAVSRRTEFPKVDASLLEHDLLELSENTMLN